MGGVQGVGGVNGQVYLPHRLPKSMLPCFYSSSYFKEGHWDKRRGVIVVVAHGHGALL